MNVWGCIVGYRALALLLLCAASAAFGEELPIRYIANVPAQCVRAERDGKDITDACHANLVNVAYTTGRALFLFNLGVPVAFSGDADEQPTPDSYELTVSVLNVDQRRIPATGRCRIAGDPMKKATYTCEAKGVDGTSFQVEMASTGRPSVHAPTGQNESGARSKEDQIRSHCALIQTYGTAYATRRAKGLAKEAAWTEAAAEVGMTAKITDESSWKQITGIYTVFMEQLEQHTPSTMGYFVLAHCVATHGMGKSLPISTDTGRAAVNRVLASCEKDSKDDDSLGGCILSGLRPLSE